MTQSFQGLVGVPLFACCSLLLRESPPEFARRATFFLCWCKERRQRKHLTTHLTERSHEYLSNTAVPWLQLASRLKQRHLDT